MRNDQENGPPHGRTVAIATLGCKVNQYESAALAGAFSDRGYEVVPFGRPADVFVINTCTVTGRSDYQNRQLIRRAFRLNPEATIVAAGCYAQVAPEEIAAMPEVSLVVGSEEKMTLPERIATLRKDIARIQVGDIGQIREINFQAASFFPGHTRAFLKIQDGCNAWCSYCIIPRARGRSRSLAPQEVLAQIGDLARSGYQEVVLTGIHLGVYGMDLVPQAGLVELLKDLEREVPLSRIRLSSLEPGEITDELIALVGDSTMICPHFHIPLQSGDNEILKAMGRTYDRAFFRDLTERIHDGLPRASIGIDVMTGFPGEDETAFQNTRSLIETMPLAYLHVFPYSRRPGTRAASMGGQVGEKTKKARAEQLRHLGVGKKQAFARRFVGDQMAVLVEGRQDKDKKNMQGLTDNYLTVVIQEDRPELVNRIVSVRIEAERDGCLVGRITDDG